MIQYLVMLNVPPDVEELVVDCLLVLEHEQGFCSFPIRSHHHDNQDLSLAEQVSGRQKKIRFQVMADQKGVDALLASLRDHFSHSGISYWIFPISDHGVI